MRNKFWSKNISKNMAHFGFENKKTKWKKYQQCYISFAIATQGENRMNETSCPLQQFILAHNSISS